MSLITLDIIIRDQSWRRVRTLNKRLQQAADATSSCLPKNLRRSLAISVLLTNNRQVRRLNHDFRGIDKPTNVLSFPQMSDQKLTKNGSNGERLFAGDIALGYQYIVAEAKKDHKILINHILHLLIHGILHILGYDHISTTEAVRMERLETKIMATLGLDPPYVPQSMESKAR